MQITKHLEMTHYTSIKKIVSCQLDIDVILVLSCLALCVRRDLMSWVNGIRGLVSSEELAKDVTGAEALLERHQVIEYDWFRNQTINITFY